MAIVLTLLLAFIGMMVAAIGALLGMGAAAFFGLPATICVPTGAAIAVLGALIAEHHASQSDPLVSEHR
jgi:hypothetical protein